MRKDRFAFPVLLLFVAAAVACSPWIKVTPDVETYSFLDITVEDLHANTEKHLGKIFEGRIKFYRIYRSKEDQIPSLSRQTIIGKTYFTARPVNQASHVVRIQITPRQDKWIRKQGIERQDIIKARARFAGYSHEGSLAFDLMEILE